MEEQKMAQLVAVDMGYGHQRAAHALKFLSGGEVINANNYPGISKAEKASWKTQTGVYEKISALKKVPILGMAIFSVMDLFQDIPNFYPRRDLSARTAQLSFFFDKVKKGMGRNLINRLKKSNLPLVSTFPVPVYFAEYYKFNQPLYCVVCDADISRFWAPIHPKKSKAIYLATTARAAKRLTMYGVKEDRIKITGFPLPTENIGGPDKTILKKDLAVRLRKLDVSGAFKDKWRPDISYELPEADAKRSKGPITLIFAVGGAGAQAELAVKMLISLKNDLRKNRYKIILSAGVRAEVAKIFRSSINNLRVPNVEVLYAPTKDEYFTLFNKTLRNVDILITKPSELSFFAGLGLPILMTEPVGAQEIANRDWLLSIGAGIDALNFKYTHEWLRDMLHDGRFARAAFLGYREAETMGAYNIENIIKEAR
ncbi:MAG: hypothetical protein WCO55_00480 [Candidatus Falkowbacteria bacterium]